MRVHPSSLATTFDCDYNMVTNSKTNFKIYNKNQMATIHNTYKNLPPKAKGHVIAIGNFDGVHKGHQALIQIAKDIATEKNTAPAILTFEPHPRQLFRPDDPPNRLTPPTLKYHRLQTEGIETIYALPFDWNFASQSYKDFIQNILIDGLNAKHIIIGHDFRFGQMRKGEPKHIQAAGIPTTIIEKIQDKAGETYSSSRIRQALRHGKILEANQILGWDWEIHGKVIKGDQRGRDLGYPTANIALGNTIHPAYGIYAAQTQIKGETTWHPAAINIGIRPMFEIPTAALEAHLLDFNQDLYGKTLKIRPIKFLRGEAKFETLDELKAQMEKDCEETRKLLS